MDILAYHLVFDQVFQLASCFELLIWLLSLIYGRFILSQEFCQTMNYLIQTIEDLRTIRIRLLPGIFYNSKKSSCLTRWLTFPDLHWKMCGKSTEYSLLEQTICGYE